MNTTKRDDINHPSGGMSQLLHGADSVLRALLEEATDCIAVKDVQGRYQLINPAGAAFLGYEVQEVIGKTDFELFSYETALKIRESDEQVMFSGKTEVIEDLLISLRGKPRYFQAMKCVYKSTNSETLGIINVVRDTTDRRVAELALMQTNHDLEQFASVVSHDLQAPLRKISYFVDALEGPSESLPEEGRDYLQRIRKTAKNMSKLITEVLAFSRLKRNQPRYDTLNLRLLVEEAIQELNIDSERVNPYFELGELNVFLAVDATQIRQLLVNLFSNALKFRKSGLKPCVRVSASETPFNRCMLTIADNGIGFDEKYASQIFKPFERLHSVSTYPGTGVGLAICERIVERHNGKITAKSTPGEGATFYVELPIIQE